ncbi:serine/threonine-protein kinase [Actinokineospora enzanensis]|uniref:serine/threonine-protein kinase n=1 Tax=Actinokineospora enzanensis TaxID=155975 RepID=UPI00039FAD5B|nr:serine/threonine-protein kinase [Actinokineospora enzanensis]
MDDLRVGPFDGDRTPVAEAEGWTGTGRPVTILIVTAPLDNATRRRLRDEAADLEARLAGIDEHVVAPLIDHDADDRGRPRLVLPRRGVPVGGPLVPAAAAAAARAFGAGLAALERAGVAGPVPALYEYTVDGRTGLVLGTPLPPGLVELLAAEGVDEVHSPPEVLSGGPWDGPARVYACASRLWAMLTGRPPHPDTPAGRAARLTDTEPPAFPRPGIPVAGVEALRAGLRPHPAARPSLVELTATVAAGLSGPLGTGQVDTVAPGPAGGRLDTGVALRFGSGYLLDEEIGQGAMGVVMSGRRRDDGAEVAVKMLRPGLGDDPAAMQRFVREAAVIRGLLHPNVVRVHEILYDQGRWGIVMDLVRGENLRQVAERGALSLADAAALLCQVSAALAAVHAHGIVHRDIKPENILLTGPEHARTALLSDFGIARATDSGLPTELVCTPAFVAPEIVRGEPPTAASDVYSLGVTAYELLAGRRPFTGSTAALLQAHVVEQPPRPPGLADPVWALVAACLDKRPQYRPPAAELVHRWGVWVGSGTPTVPPRAAAPVALPLRDPLPVPAVAASGVPGASVPIGGPTGGETGLPVRPIPVEPAPAPRAHAPRRRWPLTITVLALTAVVGTVLGVHYGTTSQPDPVPTQGPEDGGTPLTVAIPVDGTVNDEGTAQVRWTVDEKSLPGLSRFVVIEQFEEGRQTQTFPPGTTTAGFPGLRPGQRVCFFVYAYGVTPPAQRPQPTTATPPPPWCATR